MNTEEKPMTTEDVARLCYVNRRTVWSMVKRGELHARKVGNRWLFNPKEVRDYVGLGEER
jgi:excisionase family DNA binding protein